MKKYILEILRERMAQNWQFTSGFHDYSRQQTLEFTLKLKFRDIPPPSGRYLSPSVISLNSFKLNVSFRNLLTHHKNSPWFFFPATLASNSWSCKFPGVGEDICVYFLSQPQMVSGAVRLTDTQNGCRGWSRRKVAFIGCIAGARDISSHDVNANSYFCCFERQTRRRFPQLQRWLHGRGLGHLRLLQRDGWVWWGEPDARVWGVCAGAVPAGAGL